jgi:hypothetical protein
MVSLLLFFVFDVVCYLQVMDSSLHSSKFG